MGVTISPSILNCDIANLAAEIKKIKNADYAHVDVMDNHFVPNLSWGLRPATDITPYIDILPEIDMLLVMTVEPGFGGQSFLESMMAKVRRTREAISAANLQVSVQVDGGITRETISVAAEAGADVFVAGSAVYKAEDAYAEVEELRRIAQSHC